MCDFDITSFREKATTTTKQAGSGKEESSFSLYLKKRKMLGLDNSDSDSDDDDDKKVVDPLKKRKGQERQLNEIVNSEPPSERNASPSPLDTELANLATEKALIKQKSDIEIGVKTTTHEQLQQSVQNATEATILLDTNEPAVNRNDTKHIIDVSDLTTKQYQRRQRSRPSRTISLDIEDLDPELASLFSQDSEVSSTGDTSKPDMTPQKVQIKVSYVSLMETVDSNIRNIIDALSKPVKIIMLNNSPFDTLMEQFCKKKRLLMQDMVLVYDNIPVVLRATPSTLSMSTTSTNKMEVYKRSDFDKKMEMEKEIKAARLSQCNDPNAGDSDDDDGYNSQEHEEQPQEEYLHIKLRGKDSKDICLRVKPTTRIDSIINQYIRLMEWDIAPDKVQLSFEGEIFETSMTIADTDLEDEDMVSVMIHS